VLKPQICVTRPQCVKSYITFVRRSHLVPDCLHISQHFTHSAYIICTEQRINAGLQAAVYSNSGYEIRLKREVTSRRSIQNSYIYIVCTTSYWFPRPRCVFWTNNSKSSMFWRNAIESGSRHIVAEKFPVWNVDNNIPFL